MRKAKVKKLCRSGAVLLNKGQPEQALDVFNSALVLSKSTTERGPLYYNIALSLYQMERDSEAIDALDKALRTDISTHYPIERAMEFPRFHDSEAFHMLLKKHGIISRSQNPSIWTVLLSNDGRISRRTFWIKGMLPTIIFWIFIFTLTSNMVGEVKDSALIIIPFYIIYITCIVIQIRLYVKRLHDCDIPGWSLLIPILNLLSLFQIAFIKGTDGRNKYGIDPILRDSEPNSTDNCSNKENGAQTDTSCSRQS